jgi:hypothetical protein
MPSSPIDEFTAGLQPADILTLFAGLRNTIPVYAALGATGTNEGHDEELAKRQGPRTIDAPRPLSPDEVNRRAQMDFEAQYPDPRMRQLIIDSMLRERRNPYSTTTATRRRDFEEAPITARHSMQAAPRKYANGGAIDFSVPDMADGGAFIPDPQPYAGGGSAKKTLDEMAAEMMRKGVKLADKPDLSRRSFFGFGKGSDFPLAKMDTKALEALGKDAPAITEKSVTIDPGKGAAKSTLKSISETPMSRREVLQSAAGQVMRGALPDLGGLSTLGNVAKVAESAAPAAASPLTNTYAIIMSMLKKGMTEDDIVDVFAKERPEFNKYAVENMINNVQSPSGYLYGDLPTLKTPSGALREIVEFNTDRPDEHLSPLKLRPELRQLRSADPEAYKGIINAAKDISMVSADEAASLGLKQKWIDRYMKGEIDYEQLPQYYQRKIDNINAGFGSEY